jgi:N4-gp56 family major capsid protein
MKINSGLNYVPNVRDGGYVGPVYDQGKTTSTYQNVHNTHFWDRKAIKTATENLIYSQFMDAASMPRNKGDIYTVDRWFPIINSIQGTLNNYANDEFGTAHRVPKAFYGSGSVADPALGESLGGKVGMDKYGNSISVGDYIFQGAIAPGVIGALDGGGVPIVKYTAIQPGATVITQETVGNLYGSSNDPSDITNRLPELSETAGDVNQVSISKITIATSFKQYGMHMRYTHRMQLFGEDDIVSQYKTSLGEGVSIIYDDLDQLTLLSTPNVIITSDTAVNWATLGGVATDRITYKDLVKVANVLSKNKAEKTTSIITGSTRIGTKPIPACYPAIIDADMLHELENLVDNFGNAAWTPVHEYANNTNLMNGEVGKIYEFRFVLSQRAHVSYGKGAGAAAGIRSTNGNANIHHILFPAKGAAATVGLQGMNKMEFINIPPETKSIDNLYGNKGAYAVKFWYAGIIRKPECLIRLDTVIAE